MKRIKGYRWLLTLVICLAVLAVNCAPSAEEAEIQVEPRPSSVVRPPSSDESQVTSDQAQEAVEPQGGEPVELSLKFALQDSTTYRITTQASRNIKGEGALAKDNLFRGGTTSNRIEMTYDQQIKSVDDQGNAVVEITIKDLKCSAVQKNSTILDFDSSREKDQSNPLGRLIGQSYTVEITSAGRVSKVIDADRARAAVAGTSADNERAVQLLSDNAINDRHTIPALPASTANRGEPACDKKQVKTGDNWSSVKSFSFGMMGSKSFERIYTLKEIKDVDNCRIATVEMNGIPSTEKAEELHREQEIGIFAKMFDNTETFSPF